MVTLVDPAHRPPAGSIPQQGYDLHTPWHTHDMHQLQYAFEGSIEVEDTQASYLLPRTLAAWIPAGVVHRTALHLVRSASVVLSPEMVPNPGDRIRIIEASPLMREMVLGAMRWPLEAPHDAAAKAYFAALSHLCSEWIEREAPLHLPTAPELRVAIEYTRAHLQDADIAGVCAAAGLSERTLRRRFRSLVGRSWDAYRRRARLLAAVALLGETPQSIGEIAAQVGFESQSAFARAFKALVGVTPREFRRK